MEGMIIATACVYHGTLLPVESLTDRQPCKIKLRCIVNVLLTKALLSDLTHVTVHVCQSRIEVNAYMHKANRSCYMTP